MSTVRRIDQGPAGGRMRRVVAQGWMSATAVVVACLLWELIGRSADIIFLPPLSAVLSRGYDLLVSGAITSQIVTSATSLVIGFTISVAGGVLIGALMGMYWRLEAALDIYVRAMLTAPSLVFAPVFFAIFGFSRTAVIAVVVQNALFIVILNTMVAVQSVPASLVEMARCFGANDRYILKRIVAPAATPLIMAGVRLATGRAIRGLLAGEVFIAVIGIGGVLVTAGRRLDSETVLAILIGVIVLSSLAIGIVNAIDHRLTRWLPPQRTDDA